MMIQENPRMPFEVLFQFIGEAFPSGRSNTYSEVFWGESADDVRNTVMAGTTSNHIHILEIKEKKSNVLWTQEPESFSPHSTSRTKELINISDKPEPLDHSNLLINFNEKSCDWFSRFDSVTEIIISDPTNIKAKQKSYTHYKRFGYGTNVYGRSSRFYSTNQ